jgi:hypothetical protein
MHTWCGAVSSGKFFSGEKTARKMEISFLDEHYEMSRSCLITGASVEKRFVARST